MRKLIIFLFISFSITLNSQTVEDDFEGSGTITSWSGDDCGINTSLTNPYQQGINTSSTVLEYNDIGGQYANVRFDVSPNFDLTVKNSFSLKIYVPSSGLTGSQTNQISLKLQDGTLGSPWLTQSEVIKPIILDQWQEVTFNFETDAFINLDGSSPPPIQRTDFNRVVIQVNSENNNDFVLAYIDDILHLDIVPNDPVYDNLVWFDEFDGNGAIDSNKWHHQTQIPSGGSWYNGEIQHYTDRTDNSNVSGGFLYLTAKEEVGYTDQGVTKDYTSARLNSKFAFTFGKIEIKAQLPTGVGTWPAIWMLGKNINEDGAYWDNQGFGTTGWPACGEIDIMEHWGNNQNFVQSAMHTPSSSGNTVNKGGQTVSTASTNFHIYTLEWSPEKMVFSVDDVIHYTYNPDPKTPSNWPFTAEQYILLNTAVLPEIIGTGFTESSMIIDYVRVYQESNLSVSQFDKINKVHVYPNPTSNDLIISLKNVIDQKVNIHVLDVNGKIISEKQYDIQNEQITHDTSSLKVGMYYMKLTFEDGTNTSFKVIKK